ncbi:MAG TPA: hypothetical protein VGJ38_12415, partial [Jatrophihabitantaceae bacterium]
LVEREVDFLEPVHGLTPQTVETLAVSITGLEAQRSHSDTSGSQRITRRIVTGRADERTRESLRRRLP